METRVAVQPSILIVDDDSNMLVSYTVLLEDEFRVYTAGTGEEGVTVLQEEDINIILLDIRLPGWSSMNRD